MNSKSSVNRLMIHGGCCRDSACWLTLNCTPGEETHKRVTVDADKTPRMLMEKQAWKAQSVDKIAIY